MPASTVIATAAELNPAELQLEKAADSHFIPPKKHLHCWSCEITYLKYNPQNPLLFV